MRPRSSRLAILALIATALIGPAWAATTRPSNSGASVNAVRVVSADFGIFENLDQTNALLRRTNVVPYAVGQPYGWTMRVETRARSVRVREAFTLPVAPASWGDAENDPTIEISRDRRTATSELSIPVVKGTISRGWEVVEGDPRGHHVVRVRVENEPERTFEFDLE